MLEADKFRLERSKVGRFHDLARCSPWQIGKFTWLGFETGQILWTVLAIYFFPPQMELRIAHA